MGINHSMNTDQVDLILGRMDETVGAVRGIENKFTKMEEHMQEARKNREALAANLEESTGIINNLVDNLNNKSDDAFRYVNEALDSFALIVEEFELSLANLGLHNTPKQIQRELGPLLVPAVVLVLIITVSNCIFGMMLASDENVAGLLVGQDVAVQGLDASESVSSRTFEGEARLNSEELGKHNVLMSFAVFHIVLIGVAVIYIIADALLRQYRRSRRRRRRQRAAEARAAAQEDDDAFLNEENELDFRDMPSTHSSPGMRKDSPSFDKSPEKSPKEDSCQDEVALTPGTERKDEDATPMTLRTMMSIGSLSQSTMSINSKSPKRSLTGDTTVTSGSATGTASLNRPVSGMLRALQARTSLVNEEYKKRKSSMKIKPVISIFGAASRGSAGESPRSSSANTRKSTNRMTTRSYDLSSGGNRGSNASSRTTLRGSSGARGSREESSSTGADSPDAGGNLPPRTRSDSSDSPGKAVSISLSSASAASPGDGHL
eukprot:gnl/TRDRNA2_/TRDRNA2_81935_c0_seq1.p1 gnl/TRDRNA2_/TRDRNA2_81935_c0~~gnl/TRDRNA2_/TRDRNA2_81935_c0_seq1.p1  ORF type:complete len:492 (+),score=58.06 gnl/TRDRNA2_/TRDRNA2_81935_c0_seq1:95-1570(+)